MATPSPVGASTLSSALGSVTSSDSWAVAPGRMSAVSTVAVNAARGRWDCAPSGATASARAHKSRYRRYMSQLCTVNS